MRTHLIALAIAAAACGAVPALAEGLPAAPSKPSDHRTQLGDMLGERIVREVMVSPDGGSITVIYDMGPQQPQSQRVVRLENVNGMLEVIYDAAMPSQMALGSGGVPRLVQGGGGMYSVEYGPR